MKIKSAEFVKGIMGEEEIISTDLPSVCFIGRSNVGKSSVLNSIVNRRDLARSSATAGRTKEINFFLVNKSLYLVDLPGYGFAKASLENRENLRKLIYWYLLYSEARIDICFLIIDSKVGLTEYDKEILRRLKDRERNVVVIANKIDKLKKNDVKKSISEIERLTECKVIPYSTVDKTGLKELHAELTKLL